MRGGQLRKRIQLQTRSASQDTSGSQSRSWSNYAIVWAEIEPLSASEKFYAGQLAASVSHQITIRFNPQLASLIDPLKVAQMRGVYTSRGVNRYFYFSPSENEGERNRYLIIPANEGAAAN
jgi:head-tail adaptor